MSALFILVKKDINKTFWHQLASRTFTLYFLTRLLILQIILKQRDQIALQDSQFGLLPIIDYSKMLTTPASAHSGLSQLQNPV